ncbi:MAG: hypothetical protein JKY34_03680 [Kordiimonadaceae bacterium]|nr:hypothetical protein [Kordiimonadaceae bacterium]
MGLALKANIDDLRSSPALDITVRLSKELDCTLLAVEPNIEALPEELENSGVRLTSMLDALDQADILVLLVDHKPFKRIPEAKRAEKIIIDTRGIWASS